MNMSKPEFEWKWNTSQDVLVLSDFTRYLVHLKYQLMEGDPGFEDAYKKTFNPIYVDWKCNKLTQLRHGSKLATYVSELEQYLPKNDNMKRQDEETAASTKALNFMQKFKSYLVTFDDGLINADAIINGLRKHL